MKKIDTFSANSLKLLQKDKKEFENRYIYNLYLRKNDTRTILGQKFHALICYYLRGFDTVKLSLELNHKEREIWKEIEDKFKDKKNNFIKTEYPFLIKEKLNSSFYYLTGRFDAIYKENENYIIYDWKTLNIPKDAQNDLQTIVYLYCAGIIFKTNKIKMRYLALEKLETIDINFKSKDYYKKIIDEIILKYKHI